MTTDYRSLTLLGAQDGALRTAVFRGTEHVVVPVIALMEGVVHAVNAPHAELVLASELSRTPAAWNGEPVMFDHPDKNGQKVSANTPEILEALQLGQVFNSRMDGTRLRMDAYVDPSRADKVGEGAKRLLDILAAGGVVEVSVGAFVTTEEKTGVYQGKSYKAVWRDIVPDHLALLPEGTQGACSAKSGCGAGTPRANAGIHLVTAAGITHVEEEGTTPMADPVKPEGKSLRQRMLEMIKSLQSTKSTVVVAADAPEGTSDIDLRRALDDALRASEPAYQGIDAVFPDGTVVYAVNPEGNTQVLMRSFTLTDGTVALGDEKTEVEPVMRYEPVAAAAEATPKAAACGCHKKSNSAVGAPAEEPRTMHKNAERITSLIANPKTPFNEADRTHLETQPDERISALEAAYAPEPAPVAPAAITLEQLPEAWRKAIEAQAAQEAATRTSAIDALAASQSVFSKADLEAMPVDQLTKIATLAGTQSPVTEPTSFAGRAPVARVASSTKEAVPAAPDFNAAVRAAQAKRAS